MSENILELDKAPSTASQYPYTNIFNQLIEDYKDKIEETQNAKEVYKWRLIQDYQVKWDDNTSDFNGMLTSIDFDNLVFHMGLTVLKQIAKVYPTELRDTFKYLYDETLPLQKRIDGFQSKVTKLYNKLGVNNLPTHQDERNIATFLAFRYPEKYTLYKWSFYYQLCKALGLKEAPTGKKYCHYLSLVKDFLEHCVNKDDQLIQLKKEFLTEDCHPDPNNMILAQDILYQMLDQTSRCSYWKIGSKAGSNGNSIWPEMKQNSVVSIGWEKLGNLSSRDALTKQNLANELLSEGYYTKKGIASRKAGEILNFYQNIKPGDIVVICEGETALGIAKVNGDYEFNQTLDFPHYRAVEILAEPTSLKISDGPQTSVYKIDNPLTIVSIERMINNPQLAEEPKPKGANVAPEVSSKNIILYGPPGTGKTYNTINKALEIIGESVESIGRVELKKSFDRKVAEGQIVFTTFHQNMSYEDFIEGIKPQEASDKEGNPIITYKVEPGIFRKICKAASKKEGVNTFDEVYDQFLEDIQSNDSLTFRTPTHKKPFRLSVNTVKNCVAKAETNVGTPMVVTKNMLREYVLNAEILDWKPYTTGIGDYIKSNYNLTVGPQNPQTKPFVLIIDEINRGNVSQIFGELITLIEEDKRLGGKEQLEVTLPYSKEKFGVPANLFIIGTMNTADRSVEALDTALRRRFSFVEMPPRYDLEGLQKEVEGYKLADILRKINRRIEKLLGKDNLIGHSYFLCVNSTEDLRAAFQNKIIPLLQEYFYGDYGKIGLVLGEGFFQDVDEDEGEDIFASFGSYDSAGLDERRVYHLAELIGASRLRDTGFREALDKLMK